MHQKLAPDPFLILLNNLKTATVHKKFFLKKGILKDYQKALKKLSLFFLTNPVPFIGQSYQKQKGSGTSQ